MVFKLQNTGKKFFGFAGFVSYPAFFEGQEHVPKISPKIPIFVKDNISGKMICGLILGYMASSGDVLP
jgi:hypothetical protein